MITNIFSRSNPMNYIVCGLLILIAFIFVSIHKYSFGNDWIENLKYFSTYPVLLFSVYLTDFIIKKNNINKSDDYAILLFSLFLILIPEIFLDFSVVISNLFVLLAFRKLASIQSLIHTKQKVLDASIWISLAAVFEFWSILFLILVFASIIIHISNDFKNWLIPLVGIAIVFILTLLYAFLIDYSVIEYIKNKASLDFDFSYLTEMFHTYSLGIFLSLIIILVLFQVLSVRNYLATLQNSTKKVIVFLILAFFVYLVSSEKNNGLLLYCIAPLSIIGSNFIHSIYKQWMKEGFVFVTIVLSIISLVLYL